ncbi:unnamed protein product [Tuber aestivum]|uniref:F-box domain-containing protein n=1 Tax=Tuber aestivum TaxID=59557 RepID=A0A292PVI1_9PEZI|nr:unnamed protein product [Tuber aestivum]
MTVGDDLDPPPKFDTLALLFSHYTIITEFSKMISTGDLIRLSRTSSTIRETLLQSRAHWERLVSLTSLECSEEDHIKGEKIKSCKICSMPVCETCIVRADFFGQNGTYSNRIRTFCDTCWSATDFSDTDLAAEDLLNHVTPVPCECVARDGWLCSSCRAIERSELVYNKRVCATDGCENPHNSSEKHRVCTWCQRPLPAAWRPVGEPNVLGRHIFNEDGTIGVDFADEGLGDGGSASPVEDRGLRKVKSTDKIAGWDHEDEDSKARYKEAWLKKGARERERDKEHQSESSGSSQQEGRRSSVVASEAGDGDGTVHREEEQGPSDDEPSAGMGGPPPYSGS